jgi:outer membrane protein assembly factor BamB
VCSSDLYRSRSKITPIFPSGTQVMQLYAAEPLQINLLTGHVRPSSLLMRIVNRLRPCPDDVKLLWEENRFLRGVMSQPLYRDGHVYLLDKTNGLVCFELATGRVVWTGKHQLTPRGRNPQANMVWLGDTDRAIVLNASGELILIRLTTNGYSESSRTKIIGETWAHPAFAGNDVFARDDQEIVCVQIGSGK